MNVGFINQNVSPRVNMGLAYIMTMANERYPIFFWDIVGRYKGFSRYLTEQVRQIRPKVIGFSVNSYTFRSALLWAKLIKDNFPDTILLYGGVHPTINPLECIKNPLVDMICIGEGEYAVLECLECIAGNKNPEGVPGIWYKDKQGAIIKNPSRPFIENLDTLPFPDWGIWNIDFYLKAGGLVRNSLNLLASRGCYHSCNFCTVPAIRDHVPGSYHRLRSAENIIAEIKNNYNKYRHRGFQVLNFSDPLFGVNQEQYNAFITAYTREGLAHNLPWVCETRPEVVTPEWSAKAAGAGCLSVSLGVESADEDMRNKVLGKNISNQDIAQALENLNKNSVPYILYLMIGAPGETAQSLKQTIAFAERSKAIKNYFLYFLPLPQTTLMKLWEGDIIVHSDSQFDDGYWNKPNIRLNTLSNLDFIILRLRIAILKIRWFFQYGWHFRKGLFFKDVFLYILGTKRALPLANPYTFNELYQNTILQYFLDKRHSDIIKQSMLRVIS